MKTRRLSHEDLALVEMAREHIRQNFWPERHHVACVIRSTTGKIYKSLHLDIRGFDVCAEAIGLSAMLADDMSSEIDTIVAAQNKGGELIVVNPCGNCRQMILQYSPNAFVIVEDSELAKISVSELIPYPY